MSVRRGSSRGPLDSVAQPCESRHFVGIIVGIPGLASTQARVPTLCRDDCRDSVSWLEMDQRSDVHHRRTQTRKSPQATKGWCRFLQDHRPRTPVRLIIPQSRDRGFKSRPRNHFFEVYRVYVIQNSEGNFYIGITEDVEMRLAQHNDGVSKWTKSRGPWTLRWTSEAMSITAARRLENLLKRQKGGAGFYRFTGLPRSSG